MTGFKEAYDKAVIAWLFERGMAAVSINYVDEDVYKDWDDTITRSVDIGYTTPNGETKRYVYESALEYLLEELA